MFVCCLCLYCYDVYLRCVYCVFVNCFVLGLLVGRIIVADLFCDFGCFVVML